jgi:hypothetical protein
MEAATSITPTAILAAYKDQKGPYRKRPFFVMHAGTERDEGSSNRKEEQLAKRLHQQNELTLPDGDQIRFLDYQFPLKAVRADVGVGKIDLVGLTRDGAFSVIELKIGESTESPVIALLEVLAYKAIVRDNLSNISAEAISADKCQRPLTEVRAFIMAPLEYWEKWQTGTRRSRWDKFRTLHRELNNHLRIDLAALETHPESPSD